MAAPEIIKAPDTAQYQEPSPSAIEIVYPGDIPAGFRVRGLIDGLVQIEPIQEDVKRYPPVQVNMPRDPAYIEYYLNMPPSNWSEILYGD